VDLKNYQPKKAFAQKHLLTLLDYTGDEILQTLSLALRLKEQRKAGIPHPLLPGKTLAMIFTKSSTRTRVSFETGIYELGGQGLFLSSADIQLGRGETIADTARTLSRMVGGIMIRTFAQGDVAGLAEHGSVPVINGLTDLYHPCQALADMQTLYEHTGRLSGARLAYIGDGNNVAHSLMIICAKLGIHMAVAAPQGYFPDETITAAVRRCAEETGASLLITADPKEAAADADAVYTDVWASMGQESQFDEKSKSFIPYQANEELMGYAKKDALFMHCLPAHRGEEVTEDVLEGPQSVVFDQAENRLHAQKAVMALLMGEK
jgi:ornithine carbamoyltransferase